MEKQVFCLSNLSKLSANKQGKNSMKTKRRNRIVPKPDRLVPADRAVVALLQDVLLVRGEFRAGRIRRKSARELEAEAFWFLAEYLSRGEAEEWLIEHGRKRAPGIPEFHR